MRLALLGAPGAGKDTQARFICGKFGIPQISAGDMLRMTIKAGAPLGIEAKKVMDAGGLVSDDIIIGLVKDYLQQPGCENGYLSDGFPHTTPQTGAMKDAAVAIDYALEVGVPFDAVTERMSGHRVYVASGRTYHVKYNPPETGDVDDETGEPLIQRDNNEEETVRKHLDVYESQTRPLVDYYSQWTTNSNSAVRVTPSKYRKISGVGTVDEITAYMLGALQD